MIYRRAFLTFAAFAAGHTLLSKAATAFEDPQLRRLNCRWQSRKNKYMCDLNQLNHGPFKFSELYVNGKPQRLARFPNYDPSQPPDGAWLRPIRGIPATTSSPNPDLQQDMPQDVSGIVGIEFDPTTFSQRRWARPDEASVHLYLSATAPELRRHIRYLDYDRNLIWFDYRDTKQKSDLISIGPDARFFVDNVFEEMDSPGEWYLSPESGTLYFRPPADLDMNVAIFEVPA
jgi:hypothetical protein